METVVIIAAGAAVLLAGVLIAATASRARRPELSMKREQDIARGDHEGLIASITPAARSPIDREGSVIDLTPLPSDPARDEAPSADEETSRGGRDRR